MTQLTGMVAYIMISSGTRKGLWITTQSGVNIAGFIIFINDDTFTVTENCQSDPTTCQAITKCDPVLDNATYHDPDPNAT